MHSTNKHISRQRLTVLLLSSSLSTGATYANEIMDEYLDIPLEDLLSIEVTSVSKKKQQLHDAAAAVYVITQEDIRRSGVTSIPEALRLAPGLQVAKIDDSKWAISSRGFNGQFANKLLVLMDGRSVYSPTYSGVYWDAQDTLLDDIDRIEVIRGPGATLWGANAVNGVINIITKFATDTQGGLVKLGAGNEEKGFVGLRYGGELNESSHGRFYTKYFKRKSHINEVDGNDSHDDTESLRAGFRIDGTPDNKNDWTLQGDVYDTEESQYMTNSWLDPVTFDPSSLNPLIPPGTYIPNLGPDVSGTIKNTGWNLLGRWNHQLATDSSMTLQLYHDHTEREEIVLGQTHDITDIDFHHNLTLQENHEIIWGLGYRHIKDAFDGTFLVSLTPEHHSQNLYSTFIQDQIALSPETLFLTLGSKFEHNEFTGYEVQPSIRALWKPDQRSTLWGSISRAVRTPSRLERDVRIVTRTGVVTTGNPASPVIPVVTAIYGNDSVHSEKLIAYELGYRHQAQDNLSYDLAMFYNDYRELRTYETLNQMITEYDNKMSGHSIGLELALDWHPTPWWRLQTNYTYLEISVSLDDDSQDVWESMEITEGASPKHQFTLRSLMDLSKEWEADLWIYYVDELPASSIGAYLLGTTIESYTSLNARLGWKPSDDLDISLVGLNLQDDKHGEFVSEYFIPKVEVERSVYLKVTWDF